MSTRFRTIVCSLLAVPLMLSPLMFPMRAHAVTNADIEAQLHTTQSSFVGTLTEVVKLLQIQLISQLQVRVAQLQAQVEARTQ